MARSVGRHKREETVQEVILDPRKDSFRQPGLEKTPAALTNSHERLGLIYELGRAICEEETLDRVLKVVLAALRKLLAVDRCLIAAVNETGQLSELTAYRLSLAGDDKSERISETIVRRVLREGVAILSADALEDQSLKVSESLGAQRVRSVMCVPLGPKDELSGLIYMDNLGQTRKFTPADLNFVTALSHFIYLGIRNAGKLERAEAERRLSEERVAALQEALLRDEIGLVGKSEKLKKSLRLLERVANSNLSILLYGERGVGKELFARASHKLSKQRANKAFVALNLAAFTADTLAVELFGSVKGAFTSAVDRAGRLELADGGTLFLDEVSHIPLQSQPKLLRVLEDRIVTRLGSNKSRKTDFRLVCATNKDLDEEVRQGRFLEDLRDRINGITIEIPPLRERLEDLPLIVAHHLREIGSEKVFDHSALEFLLACQWPGNVRELRNFVWRAHSLCDARRVTADDLRKMSELSTARSFLLPGKFPKLKERVQQVERELFQEALKLAGGNKRKARELLGISRQTFFGRIKRYKL